MSCTPLRLFASLLLVLPAATLAQSPDQKGEFVLHKMAKANGSETYSIATSGDTYTLTSHFLFTDRGSPVPLETTFTAHTLDMAPVSYTAKGKAARISDMDDAVKVSGTSLDITRTGKHSTATPAGAWFITDGYSPVSMQEQMMRWWLSHGRPAKFTAYPAGAEVTIAPAEALTVSGKAMQGYTVSGLIWGQEALWMDAAQNLTALVSTDAEFDHFEAVRKPYEDSLGVFISAAVQADLGALERLSASARTAPAKKLAIVGATLEDSVNTTPVPDSVIVIEDGVITAAGPRSSVRIPRDATILDAKGKFAIPGLWDMHAHYEQVEWGPIYLAAGVTDVRDVGNEFDFIRTVHQALDRRQNPAIGPHLEFAGIIDGSGPLSLGAVIADTPEQSMPIVERYKAAGARQIKLYSSVKPDMVKAISAQAHARGMTVTGHIPEGMTAIEGIDDGMDQINHMQYLAPYFVIRPRTADGKPDRSKPLVMAPDAAPAKEVTQALLQHHTVIDPTMAVFEGFLHTKPLAELEPGITHLPPQLREALETPPNTKQTDLWEALVIALRQLHKAGIPMVAGTDQTIPGYSVHRELEIYVEDGGFTPLEALQSATIVAAKALGVENESGCIAKGKRGDVLLLDADPLADIHNTRKVWRTVAAGAVYEPAPLWTSVGFTP